MNNIILIGRLTDDPKLKYTNNKKTFTRFTIAVNRDFAKEDGTREADFINAVAWDKKAEIICKYVKKGNRIGIEGRIQTGSYEKEDGTKGYLTDVIVSNLEFIENKPKDDNPAPDFYDNEPDDPFKEFGSNIHITNDEMPF